MLLSIGPLQFEDQWLYKQLRKDIKDDWFPDPLLFSDMIDSGLLAKTIQSNYERNQGRYVASKSVLFNLPKENFTLRYALEMSLQDRLLYQGAAAYLVPFFDNCLNWTVFSHRFDTTSSPRSLYKPYVESWKDFTGSVRAALTNGKVLLSTDVSNYFEYIEVGRLSETFTCLLPELSIPTDEKSRVRECIDRLFEWMSQWSFSTVRGIPQNRDASSFLANIYMVPIDRKMIETGNMYFRYMDDIKIVCPDELSARRALKTLVIALRDRGLAVNAKKTEILLPGAERISEHLSELSPEIQAIDAAWNTRKRWPIMKSLQMLKEQTLNSVRLGKTQSKDFRFCVKRLAWLAACRDMPVPRDFFGEVTKAIIETLPSAPASTTEFVEYLSAITLQPTDFEAIIEYIVDSRHRIYSWQDYRLWNLVLCHGARDERLVNAATSLIKSDSDTPSRAGATLYLGRFGTDAERCTIAKQFASVSSFIGQRCAFVAVHELPFDPVIKESVAPHVREDLKGVYRNLAKCNGPYFVAPKPPPITKFIDQENVYES